MSFSFFFYFNNKSMFFKYDFFFHMIGVIFSLIMVCWPVIISIENVYGHERFYTNLNFPLIKFIYIR
jgi:hypothetical protein